MIKLRKYYKGHTSLYIHGKVKDKDLTLRGTFGDPEWVSKDITLPKPVVLHQQEWKDVTTGNVLAVTYNLSEIEEDGTIRYSDWYNGCTINHRDTITWEPPTGVETNPGPFFCLVVDDTEYWHEDIEKNFSMIQSRISDYNTELYLKAIDE